MDTEQLTELVPHYIAMLILIFGVLAALRGVTGELSFWIELVIVVIIVFAYRAVVSRLGVGPSRWEQ